MDEYITKSDAVFAACKVLNAFGGCHMGPFCPDNGCKEVRNIINNVPAADVVKVRHGKWTWKGHYLICSECGNESDRTNYCPNCGADMRENT